MHSLNNGRIGLISSAAVILCLIGTIEARQRLTPTNGWYKVACIAENLEDTDHYICTKNGTMVCLPGWTEEDKYCTTPVCDPFCINGNCSAPNTCECTVGWQGDTCNTPVCLPGCLNGNCSKPFQCTCEEGWTGMLCDKPICLEGCFHGTCSIPDQCNCHPGWYGEFCEICERLPECVFGSCERPMECICDEGYEGNFCHQPICRLGCDKETGFCTRPNECWCLPGYQGINCTECQTYPGCDQGTCNKAWECNCLPGFTGKLCNIPVGEENAKKMRHLIRTVTTEKPLVKEVTQEDYYTTTTAPKRNIRLSNRPNRPNRRSNGRK